MKCLINNLKKIINDVRETFAEADEFYENDYIEC